MESGTTWSLMLLSFSYLPQGAPGSSLLQWEHLISLNFTRAALVLRGWSKLFLILLKSALWHGTLCWLHRWMLLGHVKVKIVVFAWTFQLMRRSYWIQGKYTWKTWLCVCTTSSQGKCSGLLIAAWHSSGSRGYLGNEKADGRTNSLPSPMN